MKAKIANTLLKQSPERPVYKHNDGSTYCRYMGVCITHILKRILSAMHENFQTIKGDAISCNIHKERKWKNYKPEERKCKLRTEVVFRVVDFYFNLSIYVKRFKQSLRRKYRDPMCHAIIWVWLNFLSMPF